MELSDLSEEFNKKVNGVMSIVDNNKIISTVVCLFLVLYASLAAPKLPKSITEIFKNFWFKLSFMFLIAYMASHNPSVAIISAVALLITLQTLHGQDTADKVISSVNNKISENFQNYYEINEDENDTEQEGEIQGTPDVNDYDDIAGYAPYFSKVLNNNTKVNLPNKQMNNQDIVVEIPNVTMPNYVTMPNKQMPTVTMPTVKMPKIPKSLPGVKMLPSNNQDIIVEIPNDQTNVTMSNDQTIEEEINSDELDELTKEINDLLNLEIDQTENETETFENSEITGTCTDLYESLPGYEYGEYSSL